MAELKADFSAGGGCYVKVTDEGVCETHNVGFGVIIDLDVYGRLRGVEILSPGPKPTMQDVPDS